MNNQFNEMVPTPQIAKDVIIESLINFVYNGLETWQKDLKKDSEYKKYHENIITQKLCLFLERKSRMDNCIFMFLNQNQNTESRHAVDIGIYRYDTNDYTDESITVFECKRLPPAAKKEYVSGETGGIQRFKLEVHGKDFSIAGMIGYIQEKDAPYFHNQINTWINDLTNETDDRLEWSTTECLQYKRKTEKTYHSISKHKRQSRPHIILHHLWIDMQ